MSKGKSKPPLPPAVRDDLVVLAADKDTAEALDGLLSTRTRALRIRPVVHRMAVHPQRDPGCRLDSGGILMSYSRTHRHAIVVFDREGCGQEALTREELELKVEGDLKGVWSDRIAAVVNDPELENWVWSPSPHVPALLGWNDGTSLPDWLVGEGHLDTLAQQKPNRPKEAMEAVLRKVRKPRSSAIYRAIAETVSLAHCADPAFAKLAETLRRWFPETDSKVG